MLDYQDIDLNVIKTTQNQAYIYRGEAPDQVHSGRFFEIKPFLLNHEKLVKTKNFSIDPAEQKKYGSELYKLIFQDEFGKSFEESLKQNKEKQLFSRIRIRYQTGNKELSNIQWELLHDHENFLGENSLISISRLPGGVNRFSSSPVMAPIRILFIIHKQTNQKRREFSRDLFAAYLLSIFKYLPQKEMQLDVLYEPTTNQVEEFITYFKPHILWSTIPESNKVLYNKDIFNLNFFKSIKSSLLSIRLLILGGLANQMEWEYPSLVQIGNEIAEYQIPAVVLFPDKLNLLYFEELIVALLNKMPIDMAIYQAKAKSLQVHPEIELLKPVLFLNDPNSANFYSVAKNINLTPETKESLANIWDFHQQSTENLIRKKELSTSQKNLIQEKKVGIYLWGNAGIGKSEFLNQLILKLRSNFLNIQKFNEHDYHYPHKIISRLAASINKTEFYNSKLDSLHLNDPAKQTEWLLEMLNKNSLLLIFEDLDILTADNTPAHVKNSLINLIRVFIAGIHQNTKLIFASREPITAFQEFGNLINFLEIKNFEFDQVYTFLLASENNLDSLYQNALNSPEQLENASDPIIPELFHIQEQIGQTPAWMKLIKYAAELHLVRDWSSKFASKTLIEIRDEIFGYIDNLLSEDVRDLLLTCCTLHNPHQLDLMYFIYQARSANYKIIASYIEELVHSGLLIQEYISSSEKKTEMAFTVQKEFREYFISKHQSEWEQQKETTLNRAGEYFEVAAQRDNLLWDWIDARVYYIEAGNHPKAEMISEKLLHTLFQTNHQNLLLILLEEWLIEQNNLSNQLLLSILSFLTHEDNQMEIHKKLFEKIQQWVDNLPISLDKAKALQQLAAYYLKRNSFSDANRYFQNSARIFENLNEVSALGEIYFQIAEIYYKIKEYNKSKQFYEKSLFYQQTEQKPVILHRLGNITYLENDFNSALNFYVEALALSIELEDQRLSAKILHQLGMLHTDQRHYVEAIEKFNESKNISQALNDLDAYADTLHELGNVLFLKADHQAALEHYEKSYQISAEKGNLEDTATSLHQMGMTYHALGDNVKAIEKLNESLSIAHKTHDESAILDTNFQLGTIYLKSGEEKKSLERFQISLTLAKKKNDIHTQCDTLNEIGYVLLLQGEKLKAKAAFEESLKMAEGLNDKNKIGSALQQLALYYIEIGDKKKANEYTDKAAHYVNPPKRPSAQQQQASESIK